MLTCTLALIDPDPVERHRLEAVLAAAVESVAMFDSVEAFLARTGAVEPGCLVVSAALPRLMDLLEWLRQCQTGLPVIVLDRDTAFAAAVEIVRAGAADFIEPGIDDRHLLAAVHRLAHSGTSRADGAGAP